LASYAVDYGYLDEYGDSIAYDDSAELDDKKVNFKMDRNDDNADSLPGTKDADKDNLKPTQTRTEFPETWLWTDFVNIGYSTFIEMYLGLPQMPFVVCALAVVIDTCMRFRHDFQLIASFLFRSQSLNKVQNQSVFE